jgi:membrane protein YqaA with SNARE-associated domain
MSDEGQSVGGQHATASGRSGPNVTLIGLGVVAALFIVFFLQNSEPTVIDFLVFEKRTTIRWSILVAMMLGVALDRIFGAWWRRRGKRKNN